MRFVHCEKNTCSLVNYIHQRGGAFCSQTSEQFMNVECSIEAA